MNTVRKISEKCTRIFDHSIMIHILKYYKFYWKHRVMRMEDLTSTESVRTTAMKRTT
jgi:hypothetical protein